MKTKVNIQKALVAGIAAFALLTGPALADWEPNFQPSSYPYDFGPSIIVPSWNGSGADGEWTFNYEGALANAKTEGRYTLLLFAGLWWCPHCQALERDVLSKAEFTEYVKEQGYYLAALDFPYRDGHSMWTWLWDPAYRAANGIGDWTPEQIADEYAKRFEYQELMHTQGASTTTNNNVLVQISPDGLSTNLAVYAANPTTVYRRVGYPTIIVIDPNGREAGRFSYNMKTDPAEGLGYVIGNIETIKSAGSSALFDNPGAGAVMSEAAQVYDAVLTDFEGVPLGTATFKTAKKSARAGTIAVSGSVQIAGGRRVALKGTAVGDEGEMVVLEKRGTSASVKVQFGSEGLSGIYTDGTTNYLVQGARNPFKGKDAAAKDRAAAYQTGFWTYALSNAGDSGAATARGFSTFSVTAGGKGKVKVAGFLGDGSKVSLSSQALIGEGGRMLVPVIGKKGAYTTMLEITGANLDAVSGVSGWKSAKAAAEWSDKPADVVFASAAGAGSVPEVMYLQIGGFDSAAGVNGQSVVVTPEDDALLVSGRKWTGTKGVTDLKVTYQTRNGTFSGSFNIYVAGNGGRSRKLKAKVSGVVVNGVPYGTAVVGKVISWPVKFAGSCGGGC